MHGYILIRELENHIIITIKITRAYGLGPYYHMLHVHAYIRRLRESFGLEINKKIIRSFFLIIVYHYDFRLWLRAGKCGYRVMMVISLEV